MPGAVDDLPDRRRGVRGRLLGLGVQVGPDRGAGRDRGGAASRGRGGRLVPRQRQRSDLGQLVVGEPVRAGGGLEVEHDRGRAGDRPRAQVVRQSTWHVISPVRLLRGEHVEPEPHVLAGHRLTVGPVVVLQRDRHGLVVVAVHRRVGQAQAGVHHRLAVVAEPVQRPVHEVFELVAVVNRAVRAVDEREDPVRGRRGREGERGYAPGYGGAGLAARRGTAWARTSSEEQSDHCGTSRGGQAPVPAPHRYRHSRSSHLGDAWAIVPIVRRHSVMSSIQYAIYENLTKLAKRVTWGALWTTRVADSTVRYRARPPLRERDSSSLGTPPRETHRSI